MTLRRSFTGGLMAGLMAFVPGAQAFAQASNVPAPNLGEAPCNPPCGAGYECRGGVCEASSEKAASGPDIARPTQAEPAPSQSQPPGTPGKDYVKPGEENFIPPWVHTSDFVDTRLSFLFADENLLAKPGETTPNSPGARFAQGTNGAFNQFYDNFNTRYTGFETLSNLVLYKKSDTFFRGLSAEAALALTLLVLAEKNNPQSQSTALQDASSYIKLNYVPMGWDTKKEGISFTGFPLSADRFRLGYAYKLSWGGSNIFPNQGNSVPGAKLQFNKQFADNQGVYAYAGVKSTIIYNEQIHEQETNYGFLFGAGVDLLPELRLEANGGYFMKGVNPEPQVLGVPVNSRGASAELVYHHGEPIGYSVDFALYKNDPNHYVNFFKPEAYPGGLSYTVSIEGDFLQQTLADPDTFGATKTQNATASALQARFKYDYLRINVLGEYRTLSYIQFNVPGFPPFFDFPNGTTQNPEAFFALGADYYFPAAHFTLGAIGGMQRPASFTTGGVLGGNNPPPGLLGQRTVVVTDVNTFQVLPSGADPTNVLSVKATGRLQLSDFVAAVGEMYYTKDANRTTFKDDVLGVSEPTFQKPDILGFNVLLQARF